MICMEFSEITPLLINGRLEKELEKEALEHLMGCAECRKELAFWAKIAQSQQIEPMEKKAKERMGALVLGGEPGPIELTGKAIKIYMKAVRAMF